MGAYSPLIKWVSHNAHDRMQRERSMTLCRGIDQILGYAEIGALRKRLIACVVELEVRL
jgi:hypothetical protein